MAQELSAARRAIRARRSFFGWLAAVLCICAFFLIAPHFAAHDPISTDLTKGNLAPCAEFPLGTDTLGRCIACRVLSGGVTTVFSALLITAIVFAVGMVVGVVSGYIGGAFDVVVMRVVDAFLAFPQIVFAIAIAGLLGTGLSNAIIALSVVGWPRFARLARAQVLAIKKRSFIKAAQVSGEGQIAIALRHVLPHVLRPVIVAACLDVGNNILSLAGLSFLGLGAAPPNPEWGSMLNQGAGMMQTAPWAVFGPGLAILVVVLAMNMFGDAANEYLDPRNAALNKRGGMRNRLRGRTAARQARLREREASSNRS